MMLTFSVALHRALPIVSDNPSSSILNHRFRWSEYFPGQVSRANLSCWAAKQPPVLV